MPRTQRPDDSALAHLPDRATTVDDLLDALSNERRRAVVSFLRTTDDDAVALSELTEQVRAREAHERGERDERETVATALHHVHLPKLADAGLLDYDAGSNTVRFDRHPDRERRVALAAELMSSLS